MKTLRDALVRALYAIRNWKAHARALFLGDSTDGNVRYLGELSMVLVRNDGRTEDLGVVSRRVVTTAGVVFMATDMFDGSTEITNFNYHDSGTGTNAENISDVDLQTPAGPTTRATGTKTNVGGGVYKSVGTITYAGSTAVTEHGIFNQAARGAGSTLWDRSVFSVVNMASGESIQFSYTLTIAAGG